MEVISGKLQKAQKVVIYGPEGIGKSSFAAQFPNPIFIDTEGSTTQMNVNRLAKPSSWEMLKQQVQWVKQQGNRFGTLVVDTVDWAEMLCIESICAAHQKKGIEDFGYGKGYVYVEEEIGRFLNLCTDVVEVGIHVVLVAHTQIIKFEQPDEMGAYDRYQLKLGRKTSNKTAPLVKEWADMVLFINYKTFSVAADKEGKKNKAQGGARTIYATHHPAWDAKNRHGLPDDFPLDYSKIAHIFSGTFQASAAPAVTPPPAAVPTPPAEQPTVEQPPAPPATPEQPPSGHTINSNIPKALLDLMTQHQVTEVEIQLVVSQKGYYPADTPIENYDPNFISGVLVGAWSKVFEMIQEYRASIPFK